MAKDHKMIFKNGVPRFSYRGGKYTENWSNDDSIGKSDEISLFVETIKGEVVSNDEIFTRYMTSSFPVLSVHNTIRSVVRKTIVKSTIKHVNKPSVNIIKPRIKISPHSQPNPSDPTMFEPC